MGTVVGFAGQQITEASGLFGKAINNSLGASTSLINQASGFIAGVLAGTQPQNPDDNTPPDPQPTPAPAPTTGQAPAPHRSPFLILPPSPPGIILPPSSPGMGHAILADRYRTPAEFSEPAGRPFTQNEKSVLYNFFQAIFPATGANEYLNIQLSETLANITLYEPQDTWNPIVKVGFGYGGASAMALGPNQYYRILPRENSLTSLPLLTHETMHSLHASGPVGTGSFVIEYAFESGAMLMEGSDPYMGITTELFAYAAQDTMKWLINDPTLSEKLKKKQLHGLTEAERNKIRTKFLHNLIRRMDQHTAE